LSKVKTKRAGRLKKWGVVGVLMGGVSEEREISLMTGNDVLSSLLVSGYDAVGIDAGPDVAGKLAEAGAEVVFIALHGRYGEDGCIQGMLEVMGIPYTGSGVLASALAMDKAAAKKIFLSNGILTPAFRIAGPGARVTGLGLPLIVKPANQGSAIGARIVRKRAELKAALRYAARFGPQVMVEEYIEGRELTVSILGSRVLPIIEIRPKEGFYDFKAKYTRGATNFIVPAPLKKSVEKREVNAAALAFNALGCRGAARVDIMLDGSERPYVLEVNTIPGLTELSLFPRAARAAGIGYRELIKRMLNGAALDTVN
jgi:D-alanine-D-alanine ligase